MKPAAIHRITLLGFLAVLWSCGDATQPASDPDPTPQSMEISGLPGQAAVGSQVTVTVRVIGSDGAGYAGASVTLSSPDGATFTSATETTGANGTTAFTVTLPTVPGTVRIDASSGGLSASGEVQVTPGSPAGISIVAGDSQTGAVETTLPTAIAVRVVDEFDNAVAGASVTFEGTGGASVSAASVTTGTDGQASTEVTLGSEPGAQGAVAEEATAGQVTFQFTAERLFTTIEVGPAGATLSEPYQTATFSSVAKNSAGETVSNITFTWASSDPAVATVDTDGTATALKDGTTEVTASAQGVTSNPVVVTVAAGVVIDRAEAIAAARTAVVDAVVEGCFGLGLAPQRVLATGSTVTTGITATADAVTTTMSKPTWFMVLDRQPLDRWGHSVDYIFVDAETGAVTVQEAEVPPVVNGELMYLSLTSRVLTDERFHPAGLTNLTDLAQCGAPGAGAAGTSNQPGQPGARPLSELGSTLARQSATGRVVGVVINGGHPPTGTSGGPMSTSFDRDAEDMTDFLENTVGAEVTQYSYRNDELLDVINGIRQLSQDLGPDDKLVIYYVGHGLRSHLAYGSGTPNEGYLDLRDPDNEFGLQGLLESLPVGTINVALDACYSGSAITEMTSDGFIPGAEGGRVNLFAGANKDKTGNATRGDLTNEEYDDWKNDPALDEYRDQPWFDEWFANTQLPAWIAGTEGTYTQNFLDQVEGGTVDSNGDGEVSIAELEASWNSAQTGVAGMGQSPPGTGMFTRGSLTITAPDISFDHDVGVTGCPQSIGTIRLTNTTSSSASFAVSTSDATVRFRPSESSSGQFATLTGSVPAGQTVEITVLFSCSQSTSFTASFTTTLSNTEGGNQSATTSVTGTVGEELPLPALFH